MKSRAALCAEAERVVKQAPLNLNALPDEDIQRQELRVPQLELERQNDDLRKT